MSSGWAGKICWYTACLSLSVVHVLHHSTPISAACSQATRTCCQQCAAQWTYWKHGGSII